MYGILILDRYPWTSNHICCIFQKAYFCYCHYCQCKL